MSAGGGQGYYVGGIMGIPRTWVPTGPSPSDAVIDRGNQGVSTGQDVQVYTPAPVTTNSVYSSPAPAATPPPAPIPPPAATTYSVKQPDASLVKYHPDVLPQELITDLLFEDVGGSELINIARYDTINGQDVVYSLVKNLSILNRSFNPNNILAGQTASSQFGQYSLDIASKLQSSYLDADGNLVIEFSSINNDEYAEIELSTNGTIYNIGMVIIG